MSEENEKLLNKKEAAALLGISVSFLNKLVAQNEIPKIRLGFGVKARVRFKKSAIYRFLESRTVVLTKQLSTSST